MLCFVFSGINGMPVYKFTADLPISNYNPKKTYAKIVRLCIEIIDRAVLKNREATSLSLLETLKLINPHLKITYYDEKNFNSLDSKKKYY